MFLELNTQLVSAGGEVGEKGGKKSTSFPINVLEHHPEIKTTLSMNGIHPTIAKN